MTKDPDKAEPSMDDILASIRRIIDEDGSKTRKPPLAASGKAGSDILELTEMVNEDGSVTSLQKTLDAAPDLAPRPMEDDEPPIYADRGERDRSAGSPFTEKSRPVLAGDPRPAGEPQPTIDAPTETVSPRPQMQPAPAPAAPSAPVQPPRIMSTPTLGGISLTPVNTPPQPPAQPQASPSGLVSGQTANAATAAFDRLAQAALQQQTPPTPATPRAPSPTVGGRALEDMVGEMLRPMLQQWLDSNLPGIVERLVQQEIQKMSKR
jgi:cell pole-organizing protein PopZ